MTPSDQPARFMTRLMASVLGCFGLQAIAYFVFHLGAAKTESNYFSTISRFQGAVAPGAEIAVVGSSISGRLPGRESGNMEVANLGSDGGSPLDGLTMLNEGLVGRPRWLVLETNTLFSSVGFAETPAVAGSRGPWFRIGGHVPLFGASARPSGMLYGGLLGRKREDATVPFPLQSVPSAAPGPNIGIEALPVPKQERIKRLGEGLLKATRSGTRLLLARYPAGTMKQEQLEEMNAAISWLHQQTGAPYLDLESQIPNSQLVFTDSVHLSSESAARLLVTIREAAKTLETTAAR